MSRFGYFSSKGREYVFMTPKLPRPMLNYLWNARILSAVNHLGGGEGAYGGRTLSYIDPEGKGRCSLFRNGNRYFYLRDNDDGVVWNPGWYPVKRELDAYKCTHGIGYTIIECSLDGMETKTRVFVNQDDPAEIWTITLKNTSGRKRNISVYAFAEFLLEGYARYSDYHSYVHAECRMEDNLLLCCNNAQERPHDWFNGFAASSCTISGFDTSRKSFLGAYGDLSMPEAVKAGKCRNSLAACELMAGVLENRFCLEIGQETEYHVVFGAADSIQEASRIVKGLFSGDTIENAFGRMNKEKERIFGDIIVETPDEKVNIFANYWLKQQVQLCAEVGRDTGKGFRDQLQDAWAVASLNAALAREKILETLKYEYRDGRCVRGWLPLDLHIYSDGPTWIAPAVNAYIKETGDSSFLGVTIPYLDKGEGSVWEHILTAVRYSSCDLGAHNLVLAHDGDWNDSLNLIGTGGKGESVWTSISLYYALNNTAEMAREIYQDKDLEKEMLDRAARIKEAVNLSGWDGGWYLAAYNDNGAKIGSREEEEGSIYLNSQTWAVMTGIAEGGRKNECLAAVDEKLDSPFGPLTLHPAYKKYNPSIGRLTGFVPGIWENGTPYCHGGTFKIVADCITGRGDKAYETMLKILPDSSENPSDYSGCEPYALTNMYFGPDNPRAGQTLFAWVTGTAGWMFRAITQYMLGFYPGHGSIKIEPCIPGCWEECSMKRTYRGDVYNIRVCREKTSSRGRILLDGKEIAGNRFEFFGDGREHEVLVELSWIKQHQDCYLD